MFQKLQNKADQQKHKQGRLIMPRQKFGKIKLMISDQISGLWDVFFMRW